MAHQRRANQVLLSAVLLIALAWRGADGLRHAAQEVAAYPRADLVVGLAGAQEDRLRITAGREYALLCAVRDHVAAHEPVFVVAQLALADQLAKSAESIRGKNVYSLLYALADSPVFMVGTEQAVAMGTGYSGEVAPSVIDLVGLPELCAAAGYSWSDYFSLTAECDGARLWRWRAPQ